MLGFQKDCTMEIEDFKDFITVIFVLVANLTYARNIYQMK